MKTQYILITPVHNEEKFIEQVLKSVISQIIPPQKWAVVDDASTDRTGEIVKSYEKRHDFIVYHRLQKSNISSYYIHRTEVFLAGFEKIGQMEYDFVGALDADLSLGPTYYENVLKEFDSNPKLGIASGVYVNKVGDRLQTVIRDNISTPGGFQMFRRECYEAIGGYSPVKHGGDDSLADIMARMNGWETRSFPQYQVIHYRHTGTGSGTHILVARFYQGLTEHSLGTHPIFMLAKSVRRAFLEKPFLLGSTARLLGFLQASLKGEKREIPDSAMKFVRKEQIRRLLSCITNTK